MGDWIPIPDPPYWRHDPDAPSPGRNPRVTTMLPTVQPLAPDPRPGDIGDYIDPNAPDPTPDEVSDPQHPDYVNPWFAA